MKHTNTAAVSCQGRVHYSLITILALSLSFAVAAFSQQPPPKDRVRVTVDQTGWSDDGSLVLGTRVYAKTSESMNLSQQQQGKRSIGDDGVTAFSLASSYLTDTYTGKRIPALPRLPVKPHFSPMQIMANVAATGWVGLSVAFPAPPTPPLSSEGKPQPYRLLLQIPLDAAPVLVTIPPKQ